MMVMIGVCVCLMFVKSFIIFCMVSFSHFQFILNFFHSIASVFFASFSLSLTLRTVGMLETSQDQPKPKAQPKPPMSFNQGGVTIQEMSDDEEEEAEARRRKARQEARQREQEYVCMMFCFCVYRHELMFDQN